MHRVLILSSHSSSELYGWKIHSVKPTTQHLLPMIKPMLACSDCLQLEDLPKLRYPKWVSDKLDGIRCRTGLVPDQSYPSGTIVGLSRTLKVLPNVHLQTALARTAVGFDGEIIIPGCTFHEIQSKVMTEITLPFDFQFWLFDHTPGRKGESFLQRMQRLRNRFNMYATDRMHILKQTKVNNAEELQEQFELAIRAGNEGLIVRDPASPWKEGRSTMREEWMLKMKQFADAEAVIVDYEEEMENNNPKTKNELGYSKRSSHIANKTGKGRLGALVVRDIKTEELFLIGSGFDVAMRVWIWERRRKLKGRIITYKSHVFGVKDKPRTPIFKGFRND